MLYELYFNLNTLVATVQSESLGAVAGSFKLGVFHHDDPVTEPLTENHAIYHHVRDMLYKAGHENMQIIKIVMTPYTAMPPVFTVDPAITGTAKVNSLLTVSTGTNTGRTPITRTYQWFVRDTVNGAMTVPAGHVSNVNTFTPQNGLMGKYLTAEVTATNIDGSAKKFSNTVGPITAA